ncbi:lysophospholipid acyltransferase [Phlyctochytrium bullatum]|nr:lysophospholipid acyltransferase [Phlyctochytrium bullatum]
MLMVIKLSTFAWATYDGKQPDEKLSNSQRLRAVKGEVTLVEFLGFAFFFGGFLVGPAIEFSDYRRFTRGDYYGAWKISEGICILSGIGYNGRENTAPSSSPSSSSPPSQTSASPSGSHLFNRCENVNILGLETAQSPRLFIGSWNMLTNKWLRNSIYNRLVSIGGQHPAIASLVTWIVSALWHGFYPCYYLTFLSGAMVTAAGITLRRNVRPFVTGKSRLAPFKPVYDALGWALTQTSLNYICAPFPLYKLHLGLRVWASVGYIVHWGMALAILLFGIKAIGFRAFVRGIGKRLGADFERAAVATVTGGEKTGGGERKGAASQRNGAA